MPVLTRTQVIDAPVDEVFATVVDGGHFADWNPTIWQGAALGETNVRAQPTTKSKVLDVLQYGDPLTVSAWAGGGHAHRQRCLTARARPTGPG